MHTDSKLYMTDDLEDRISESDLVELSNPKAELDSEYNLYNTEDETQLIDTGLDCQIKIVFIDDFYIVLDGKLNSVSFGSGWMCSIDEVDYNKVLQVISYNSKNRIQYATVTVEDNKFKMIEKIDCSCRFFNKKSSFTISADHGTYL